MICYNTAVTLYAFTIMEPRGTIPLACGGCIPHVTRYRGHKQLLMYCSALLDEGKEKRRITRLNRV